MIQTDTKESENSIEGMLARQERFSRKAAKVSIGSVLLAALIGAGVYRTMHSINKQYQQQETAIEQLSDSTYQRLETQGQQIQQLSSGKFIIVETTLTKKGPKHYDARPTLKEGTTTYSRTEK